MNRWKPLVFGLVIALLTGLSISHAQEEGAEEAAPGFEAEQESVSELMVAPEEEAAENEMIADQQDEALDALLLNQEMTMFELIMKGGVVGGANPFNDV